MTPRPRAIRPGGNGSGRCTAPNVATEHLDIVIAAFAEAQDGVMTREQLVGRGATPSAIKHRLRVKRLFTIYRGVYALRPRIFGAARFRAAVYACGSDAVLSHRAAAAHQGLRLRSAPPLEATVPRGNGCRPRGVLVHRSRALPPEDITVVDGIPCTTRARTIVDCAGVLPEPETGRMIESSMILRAFDLSEMHATLARAGGRKGTQRVHSLIARLSEPPPTRSEFEHLLLDLIRSLDLPEPVVNGRIGEYEVDFHWPEAMLVVEADGRATHDTPLGWDRDLRRSFELELAGWRVVRITWRMLTQEPQRVAQLLIARLSEQLVDCEAAVAG